MEELRKDVSVRESLTRKLVRSRLKWAAHVERMEEEWLRKRAGVLRVEGRRWMVEGRKRRGRRRRGNKNRLRVSVPASPLTTGIKRRTTTMHVHAHE